MLTNGESQSPLAWEKRAGVSVKVLRSDRKVRNRYGTSKSLEFDGGTIHQPWSSRSLNPASEVKWFERDYQCHLIQLESPMWSMRRERRVASCQGHS